MPADNIIDVRNVMAGLIAMSILSDQTSNIRGYIITSDSRVCSKKLIQFIYECFLASKQIDQARPYR